MPFHATFDPAFVGEEVEDSAVSCASTVHCGGVLTTVTLVVALAAYDCVSVGVPCGTDKNKQSMRTTKPTIIAMGNAIPATL